MPQCKMSLATHIHKCTHTSTHTHKHTHIGTHAYTHAYTKIKDARCFMFAEQNISWLQNVLGT